jgi:ankyrin repeat protein
MTMTASLEAADARISVAAMNGDIASVQTLLKQGADVNAPQGDGTTALHWAALRNDLTLTELLLGASADVNAKTRLGEMTPLFMAAKNGNAEIIKALLNAGADAKSVSTTGTTTLMLAAAAGSSGAVQALLSAGVSVNAKDLNQGQTALMFAAAQGRAEVIRLLAANGAELDAASLVPTRMPNKENPFSGAGAGGGRRRGGDGPPQPLALGGMTALQFAIREGHMDAVRALVETGADVNARTVSDKMSTLTLAFVNGRLDIARYLLEHEADPKPASVEGATALFTLLDTRWAQRGWYPAPKIDNEQTGYLDLMKLLIDRGADVDARMNGRMWMRIIGPGGGPIYTGHTPFLRAALANDVEALKVLLSRGANPSITTAQGANALMLAAGWEHKPSEGHVAPDARLETVRFLVEEVGLDVNSKDDYGFTPLHGAASVGDSEVITYLVTMGGDAAARAEYVANANSIRGTKVAPGKGETVADLANGPLEKTLVFPEVIDLLKHLGSEFSDNCRAALCVNKPRG